MSNDETNITETTFFLCYNEDGNVTGDEDRDAAIDRMNDEYGGQTLRVIEMTVKVPRPVDLKASMTLPDVKPEPVEIAIE